MKIALFISAVVGLLLLVSYLFGAGKKRKGVLTSDDVFPADWRKLLEEHVEFYHKLSASEKLDFEHKVRVFLEHHNIQGYDMDVDDLLIIMVAASAVIPTFHFENWDYPKLGTILIHSDEVRHESTYDNSNHYNVLGQVSKDSFGGDVLRLSKKDLIQGFENHTSKHNVGIHEFTHLIDGADGDVDGEPEGFVNSKWVQLWSKKIHQEIEKIKAGQTKDIDGYGATSEAEFFAVISEYFFKRPDLLQQKHPELFRLLEAFFTRKGDTVEEKH